MIVFSALQIRRGIRVLLDNATATINPGQKVGLVGKNGCGKSTLLSLLKGEITSDAGTVTFPIHIPGSSNNFCGHNSVGPPAKILICIILSSLSMLLFYLLGRLCRTHMSLPRKRLLQLHMQMQ